LNKPIVLIGFKSVGKTTIGKKLAEQFQLQWFDTDKVLEERLGAPVQEIFIRLGEKVFRDQEMKVLEELLQFNHVVISTGGGIVEHPQFESLVLKVPCLKIHLFMPYLEILERIQEKPAFVGDTNLETIYHRRIPYYQNVCDLEVDVTMRREEHGQ
jgi:shikimate kinase